MLLVNIFSWSFVRLLEIKIVKTRATRLPSLELFLLGAVQADELKNECARVCEMCVCAANWEGVAI